LWYTIDDIRNGGAVASTADMLFATGEVGRKPGQRSTIYTPKIDPKPFQEDLVVNRVERCWEVEKDESSDVSTIDKVKKV